MADDKSLSKRNIHGFSSTHRLVQMNWETNEDSPIHHSGGQGCPGPPQPPPTPTPVPRTPQGINFPSGDTCAPEGGKWGSVEVLLLRSSEVERGLNLASLGKRNKTTADQLNTSLKHLELISNNHQKAVLVLVLVRGARRSAKTAPPASRPVGVCQGRSSEPAEEPPSREVWTPLHWLPRPGPWEGRISFEAVATAMASVWEQQWQSCLRGELKSKQGAVWCTLWLVV
ncbi:uncharacterized protein LOC123381504 [Felis catus]|uniref:uncharacterized protein LOC123381504 n=1 Tax=Felis catus TaxID=9685 RepID=UPI001D19EDBB|nr:uncharacterized protein LOC123381504 [Felis catus]